MKRILAICLSVALALTMTTAFSFGASNAPNAGNDKGVSANTISNEYVDIYAPTDGKAIFPKEGDTLDIDFLMHGNWDYFHSTPCYTMPCITICDWEEEIIYNLDFNLSYDCPPIESGSSDSVYQELSLKDFDKGYYSLMIWNVPVDEYWNSLVAPEDMWAEDIPCTWVAFSVGVPGRPFIKSAKAGKKKVTVKYSKASGAKKYAIYRSSHLDYGYKKIGKTSKLSYTDKKVKKGKRYYYRVRAIHINKKKKEVYGMESFAERSGKVK